MHKVDAKNYEKPLNNQSKREMKKVILTLCTGIIMCGAAYSLYNAANDYGLATISLPPGIIAQDDDTSGGDNTNGNMPPCDGREVYCEQFLQMSTVSYKIETKNETEVKVLGVTISSLKENTTYTVVFEVYTCQPQTGSKNVCVKSEQRSVLKETKEGDSTNGDSTN